MAVICDSRIEHPGSITSISADDLEALSRFRDDSGHAVSFYFKASADKAERDLLAMNLKARDIISHDFQEGRRSSSLLRDLDRCLEVAENNLGEGALLKVIFACHEKGIWVECELPARDRVLRMETGKNFNIAPLLRISSHASATN